MNKQLSVFGLSTWLGDVAAMMVLILIPMSCVNAIDQSLEQAGDNRQELEKVLTYFEDDEDPLKYEAACFLIENMPYHGTFYGKDLEKYINSYDALFAQNVEALSNGADGQNQYIVDCWNSITSEKGHTVYYCGDCSLLDGRRQIKSRSGECVYTEKD